MICQFKKKELYEEQNFLRSGTSYSICGDLYLKCFSPLTPGVHCRVFKYV